ncbi:hypothetical protein [Nonomuraea lactucae]|uniref:hypothetical protein n=1 Tax=Nonomuraea lactucae TaxID=2249762 RepID=UPI000DE31D12|nr:hypothetical protein [Nonomuraea lactucae]
MTSSPPEHGSYNDPILDRLHEAAQRIKRAHEEIRLLVAYARHFTGYRPYRLSDLATATGYSISGVRTAPTHRDRNRISEHVIGMGLECLSPEEFLMLLDQYLLIEEARDYTSERDVDPEQWVEEVPF